MTIEPARPADYVVATAGIEDLPGIVALLTDALLPANDVGRHLADFVVARAGARLIGCAGLETYGGHGLLRSVAVVPAWRGRGVASALVEAAVAHARERRLTHLYLLSESATAFFHHLGFAPTTRSAIPREMQAAPQLRGLCPVSANAMVRPL